MMLDCVGARMRGIERRLCRLRTGLRAAIPRGIFFALNDRSGFGYSVSAVSSALRRSSGEVSGMYSSLTKIVGVPVAPSAVAAS